MGAGRTPCNGVHGVLGAMSRSVRIRKASEAEGASGSARDGRARHTVVSSNGVGSCLLLVCLLLSYGMPLRGRGYSLTLLFPGLLGHGEADEKHGGCSKTHHLFVTEAVELS